MNIRCIDKERKGCVPYVAHEQELNDFIVFVVRLLSLSLYIGGIFTFP